MMAERVSGSVYMVDAMLLGRPKALSTYIILGDDETLIIDPGPPSSSETLLEASHGAGGLKALRPSQGGAPHG